MEEESRLARGSPLPIALLVASLLATGCASILEGPQQAIRIHCTPSQEVAVLVDGKTVDLVHGQIELDKKRDTHFVTFSKEGYHQSTISFNREINPLWPVADLIWGPAFPLAWLIDWQSGAVFRIDPRDLHVVLRRND